MSKSIASGQQPGQSPMSGQPRVTLEAEAPQRGQPSRLPVHSTICCDQCVTSPNEEQWPTFIERKCEDLPHEQGVIAARMAIYDSKSKVRRGIFEQVHVLQAVELRETRLKRVLRLACEVAAMRLLIGG
jgi:hypothetical protein